MDAIFFVLRTGCQWKALDETNICSGSVAHARFQQWVARGVFLKFWQEGLQEYDECKGIDWDWQSMDGAKGNAEAMLEMAKEFGLGMQFEQE